MTQKGKSCHEKKLVETIKELESKMYKVVDLQGKCPDAIAVKDNKIFAVEVLGRQHKIGKGWKKKFTIKNKQNTYSMFDGVIIRTFRYEK